ncbi:hypothetical protein C0J52_27130 [Blattella germanica]|nr:hypothetical protein C0J52_27130 [Blattella germanica]
MNVNLCDNSEWNLSFSGDFTDFLKKKYAPPQLQYGLNEPAIATKTNDSNVWFQNARAKWRRNLMRQEGGQQTAANNASNSTGGPPSVGSASVIMGDSNSLPPPEDLHHHHHHAQTTQTLSFGDLY